MQLVVCPLLQDYNQQRPSQELVAKDLHGVEWRFRHIYRGNFVRIMQFCFDCSGKKERGKNIMFNFPGQPRRHLLTTGWSIFVSQKNLVSGDAVLFLRYACFITI